MTIDDIPETSSRAEGGARPSKRSVPAALSVPNASPPSAGGKDQLLTVLRAVAILDFLQAQVAPVGLKQISIALKQSQTSVFRLLSTLESTGLVQRYESPRGYALGWKIEVLANSHLKQVSSIGPIREAVDALSLRSGQTAAAHMVSGLFAICVASREGSDPLVYRMPVGRTTSLAFGAAGKAILAQTDLDPAAVLRAAEGGLRGPGAEASIDRLRRELAEDRRTGTAYSFEELIRGVSSMAMPIFAGEAATVVGSLSLSGPIHQWGQARMDAHASLLRDATIKVSQAFGCTSPPPFPRQPAG